MFIKKRTTEIQFSKDFIDFPIRNFGEREKNNIVFNVLMHNNGYFYMKIKSIIEYIALIFSKEHISFITRNKTPKIKEDEDLNKLKKQWRKLNIILRILVVILIIPIILILALYYIPKMLYKLTLNISKSVLYIIKSKQEDNSLGFVFSFSKKNIIINHKKAKDIERVISHEHIHLLQASALKFTYNNIDLTTLGIYENEHVKKNCLSISDIMKIEDETSREQELVNLFIRKDISHIKYLLSCKELEVRLHEIVRYYYNLGKNLPKNQCQFNEMLSFWFKKTSDLSGDYLGYDINFIKNKIDIHSNKELDFERILLQILFVCYSNLIFYYGYEKESYDMKASFIGPSYYNLIYANSY